MPDRLPASFTKAVSLLIKEARLREEATLAREVAAYELHQRGWSAQRISDELKAHLDGADMSDRQREVALRGVGRSTVDQAIRTHKIRKGEA